MKILRKIVKLPSSNKQFVKLSRNVTNLKEKFAMDKGQWNVKLSMKLHVQQDTLKNSLVGSYSKILQAQKWYK